MENYNVNKNIQCNVCSCANHAKDENYCSLDHIRVNSDEENPTTEQCTCCNSFVSDGCNCRNL